MRRARPTSCSDRDRRSGRSARRRGRCPRCRRRGGARRCTTSPARRSRCGRRRRPLAAKIVVTTRPRPSTTGPPELPERTSPRSEVICAPHRPAPVGVLGDHRRGLAERGRAHVVGPVLGEAEDRGRRALRGAHVEPQRGQLREVRHAQQGQVVASGRTRSPRRPAGALAAAPGPSCRPGPATTWAFVTTTPSPATQPLPCTPSPQAVPSTFTTLRRPRAHVGVARDRASRARRTPGSGPSICGNGSKRASALSIAPRRRQAVVQLARGSPSAGSARAARARPASGAPPPRRSRRGRGRAPPPAPRPPSPSSTPEPLAEPVAQAEAEHLERRGEDAARPAARRCSANSGA